MLEHIYLYKEILTGFLNFDSQRMVGNLAGSPCYVLGQDSYIYIEIGKIQRDYTFIPTSLFRDYSLIRGFYCEEYS